MQSDDRFKSLKMNANAVTVQDLAPGIALLSGDMMANSESGQAISGKFSMVVKYEDDAWRIVSMQASSKDIIKMMLESEKAPEAGGWMKLIFAALVGLILGFVLSRAKKQPQQ
jgi:hypothetical protein